MQVEVAKVCVLLSAFVIVENALQPQCLLFQMS